MTSHSERTFTAEFHSGLRARLTISRTGTECEWTPDLPSRVLKNSETRERLLEAYRTWRDDCMREFARENGFALRTISIPGVGDALLFVPGPGGAS
jgi:hypothetical protein